MVKTYLW